MPLLLAALVLALPARAEEAARRAEFADLSIEELANIDVTSVSRRPERLQDAPASVFVITADDIRRSGARNLVEALSLAPNLQVARSSNANYFISARGMNGTSNSPANKLLVMIDGRSVYSPLFSGMFWDEPDVMLEDVERIEVISGPGGTLWGVNAVNGVINITTRRARDTQGDLLVLRADGDGAQAAFRHGAAMIDGHWRAYAKVFNVQHGELASGQHIDDDWTQGQVGWRGDWERGVDRFSVNANAWRGREGQPAPGVVAAPGADVGVDDITLHGANVTGRWEHVIDGGGSVTAQAYYDYRYRKVPPTFTDAVDILDLQLQHALPAHGRHSIVWGGEYRHGRDRVDNSRFVAFLPARATQAWASLFAQDDVALRDDLSVIAGVRWERNPYTGTEFLPNLRLSWRATPEHAFWAAVSRTVRAPSRFDRDIYVPGAPPYLLDGGSTVKSETARVAELGYRGQPAAALSYSVTAFHARYDDLRTQEVAPSRTYVYYANKMEGSTNGIEMWGTWQAAPNWRVNAGMNALHERLRLQPGSNDARATATAGLDPAHKWLLRSSLDLDGQRSLDCTLSHVAALSSPDVPAYTSVDVRYGWRPRPDWELSIAAQHLNGGGHAEFTPAATRSQFGRGVYAKVVHRF
jgi:iron complex outermembrane receptor protein